MTGASRAATVPAATDRLEVAVGQYSLAGSAGRNQDCHGAALPPEPARSLKGIALALADGIGSSEVSGEASETAVRGFLEDYYCTPETWPVETAANRVIAAINAWLHGQTRRSPYRYDRNRGHVCTFSALVLRGRVAHLFHVGDSRIYRLREGALEQLTADHRVWHSSRESYLARALGMGAAVEADYRALPLREGDCFLLATDGACEDLPTGELLALLQEEDRDPEAIARAIVERSRTSGGSDDATAQVVRVAQVPGATARLIHEHADTLPLPPELRPGMAFDGYRILRQVHGGNRSRSYLALDSHSDTRVLLKTPSTDTAADPGQLERFLLEDWIARRIDNPHVVGVAPVDRQRRYLYTATEFIEGQTLAQWLQDKPPPSLETVRHILDQVARGLRAFHRLDMLHQDLRPENLMIDPNGTVTIIDFGSTRVEGLVEIGGEPAGPLPGTALYLAPEYSVGEAVSPRSDLYSLGVLAYYLLSGDFPYGPRVARARNLTAQRRLSYRSLAPANNVPPWVDAAIRKAVQVNPTKRYAYLSEFLYDLRHPNREFQNSARPPLIERHPLAFWQGVAGLQLLAILILLYHLLSPQP